MLRFTLILVLPIVALCQQPSPSPQRQEALKYLEEQVKPCILHGRGCPEDGSLGYPAVEAFVRSMVALQQLPRECKCDTSQEACARQCYYAFGKNMYMHSAIVGKTDAAEIAAAQKQVTEYLESVIKPCIVENKGCESIEGMTDVDYSDVDKQVKNFKNMYILPKECKCNMKSERCIRVCYYSYLKKTTLATL